MSYQRKTKDEYQILTNSGYGWDVETTEETMKEAIEQARCYRDNTTALVRIKKVRVKL